MKNKKVIYIIFTCIFPIILGLFLASIIKTNIYNSTSHQNTFSSEKLFTSKPDKSLDVSVNMEARKETWQKIIDFYDEGLTDYNYQAYMYDFTIFNNTNDEVKEFEVKLTFSCEAYLQSGWNGTFEIHQNVNVNEVVETIPDLRSFDKENYNLEMYKVDGDDIIKMYKDDYIIYIPSTSTNAREMPIKAKEGTTPGFILYVAIGESIEDSTIVINYTFYRLFTKDPLFLISMILLAVWAIALSIFVITSLQIRKYQFLHERDNKIINESIETFTGFIDAKDKYTNGHSKRVAIYTKLIAKEMGYDGEELDRIYYIALLHDSGKIGVPDNILCKPGRLTDEEFEIIKSHTTRGGEILSNFKSLENAGEGALYHHERYDGNGYPKRLKGEEIPLIARMICVADSFDAMNSSRVYRKKLSKEYILQELVDNKGKQFDPKIVDIMLKLIKEGKIKLED